jgi:hypothetical protein
MNREQELQLQVGGLMLANTELRRKLAEQKEKDAKTSALYCINKNAIHPDIPYDSMNETAKMVAHTTCQHVAEAIRSSKD